ncbi:hypothetical protein MHYP_G00316740 [Metynnis hypsauchen]
MWKEGRERAAVASFERDGRGSGPLENVRFQAWLYMTDPSRHHSSKIEQMSPGIPQSNQLQPALTTTTSVCVSEVKPPDKGLGQIRAVWVFKVRTQIIYDSESMLELTLSCSCPAQCL